MNKSDCEIPEQTSAEDTRNWDDRAFTVLRPSKEINKRLREAIVVARPDNDLDDNPFIEHINNKTEN